MFKHLKKRKRQKAPASLLYKSPGDITVSVEITQADNHVILEFSNDGGKHGTDEPLAGFRLSPERLLNILNKNNDYTEAELI